MNHEKFRYIKQQIVRSDGVYYSWYLVHKSRNGVQFHGPVYENQESFRENKFGFQACGIERHSVKPLYENQSPLEKCFVTGGDCYCDGTSLGADERLGWINPNGSDDEAIWNVLDSYYNSWFGETA